MRSLCDIDFMAHFIYHIFMADIITLPERQASPKVYSVDVTHYPDNISFTVKGVAVNPGALTKIADELEKIAQIIRTDVVVGLV